MEWPLATEHGPGEPDFVIPFDRLPARLAQSIDNPPERPVAARPAATIVLLRDGLEGMEVLLMRRSRSSGFVPGAYVFPGGRVDDSDAAPDALRRLDGLTPAEAEGRLGLIDAEPPAIAYYLAALREAFEETGILVAHDAGGAAVPTAYDDDVVDRARVEVLEDRITFADVLRRLECRIAGDAIEYIAHWITPEPEPRRYDTRFFAARVHGEANPIIDRREMTDAVWLTPSHALERWADDALPMIFPTIKTLEQLAPYTDVSEALDRIAHERVRTLMPKLVVTATGVAMKLDVED